MAQVYTGCLYENPEIFKCMQQNVNAFVSKWKGFIEWLAGLTKYNILSANDKASDNQTKGAKNNKAPNKGPIVYYVEGGRWKWQGGKFLLNIQK